MSFASGAAVCDSLAAYVRQVVPSNPTSEDDRYDIEINTGRWQQTGARQVLISATGGVPKFRTARTSRDWMMQVEITMFYPDAPTEQGQQSVMQRALTDSEELLVALYTWATTTVGIHAIAPEQARLTDTGEGEIACSRILQVEYQRA